MILTPREIEIRHFHLPCGLGGSASGFNDGDARVGHLHATWRCIGGIDNDAAAVRDFERAARCRGTVRDLFSREQYIAFHGHEPPNEWREATPADIRIAAGNEHPHVVFMSSPCKGYSGLLAEKASKSAKYQALNALALRIVWLTLEAFQDDPVELIAFENVPRIAVRGRSLLDQIGSLLSMYGYAYAETVHDCGELGGLAQSRKRFLLMCRHVAKVPPFLYEPVKRPLRGVGDVLGALPLPLSGQGGPMHRMPSLQWKTWVRLAFVDAGSDWRSLNKLRVADGVLRDFALLPEREWHRTALGVTKWDEPSNTITSEGRAQNGAFSVADPRIAGHGKSVQLGVRAWEDAAATVTGQMWPGQGPFAVADPRVERVLFNHAYRVVRWQETSPAVAGGGGAGGGHAVADPRCSGYFPRSAHRNKLKVVDWHEAASTITGGKHVQSGALSVADPRDVKLGEHYGKMRVEGWDRPAHTITGSDRVGSGALSVADPRPRFSRDGRDAYITAGHYGVVPWNAPSGSVTGSAQCDNGRWSVADPRELPMPKEQLVALIRAIDGTWHRPFTTLELAALQGLVDPEQLGDFCLDGRSDATWRERIGNAVPRQAAAAMANVIGTTLLLAWSGETFQLSASPIWVQPIAVALSVKPEAIAWS